MTDADHMQHALALAAQGLGNTAPNPPVGAVVVQDGAVIGQGYTQAAGGHHAEVQALANCVERGFDPRGATMFVTLEPCCHHGKTPPCTGAILDAGITRVVVGVLDPYPPMRGRSVALLRGAGVDVVLGVEEDACARRILGFARSIGYGLPEVTLKAAITADGHLATASGESQWITGPEARAAGHALRAAHDAVMVGIGTVLADDPSLTTRLVTPIRHAVPVVVDTSLRIPTTAKVLSGPRPAIVFCGPDAPERDLNAEVVKVATGEDGRVDLVAVMRILAGKGLHRVLVEGGAAIHRALLDRGLADTLELFVAPMLLPGGRSFVGGAPLPTLADGTRMALLEVARVGADLRATYALVHGHVADPHVGLRKV